MLRRVIIVVNKPDDVVAVLSINGRNIDIIVANMTAARLIVLMVLWRRIVVCLLHARIDGIIH